LLKDEMLLEEIGWCWGKVNQVSAGQHWTLSICRFSWTASSCGYQGSAVVLQMDARCQLRSGSQLTPHLPQELEGNYTIFFDDHISKGWLLDVRMIWLWYLSACWLAGLIQLIWLAR
jgi:hypothetical protein